ncbi:hypothetical protein cyc_04193 [Cyclospora cayetanensis]|uniref:Uncharacterized protein n=1 Tax=Cyclospora cayetanensis TaxID=88456 RepID=A0A1D3CRY0_9EIME|nr:hypothetical protein cyc_04193 [Cyclospora cayetanensis]
MAKDTVWEDSLLGKREDKAVEGHPTSVAVDNPYAFIDEEIRRNRGRPEAPVDATENLELQLEALQEVLRQKIDHSLEAAEASASLLSKAVPEALTSIEDLATDTRACQEAAEQLLSSLEARGASQQESLSAVYVLHAIKKHFEDCSRIVAELHRWHFRVQEAELLLQSLRPNGLREASQQRAVLEAAAVSASLRRAASLLASLPEFEARLQAAHKLEQRVLTLSTLLLKDSVEEKSTEGFACAVAAFERLGAQEILLKELPASLKALLEKEWRSLWGQTPAGLAEDTEAQDGTTLPHEQAGLLKGVEAFDGPGASRGAPRNEPLQPSARFVAEPEALMAYAERWSSAVEQVSLCKLLGVAGLGGAAVTEVGHKETAGFIRAAAASVGTARRQQASWKGESDAALSAKPAAPGAHKSASAFNSRILREPLSSYGDLSHIHTEGDGPWNPKHRGLWLSLLLASMGAGADVPLEALERLLLRHEQPQQRLQQHLLPETAGQDGLELAEQLMEAYEVTATLISATPAFAETEATEPHLWESQTSAFAATNAPASLQAVVQMEEEIQAAVSRLLESLVPVCGGGGRAAGAPFIVTAADAALVETLNALSPRINTFHHTVALKVGTFLKDHLSPMSRRPTRLSLCIKALMERPGFFLEAPSAAAVLAAQGNLSGSRGEPSPEELLPTSYGTHAALTAASQELVVSCCCTPIELFLQTCYSDALAAGAASAPAGGGAASGGSSDAVGSSDASACFQGDEKTTGVGAASPSTAVTAVGEYMLTLLPLLEDSSPPSDVRIAQRKEEEHGQGSSWVTLLLQSFAGCYGRLLLSCLQQASESPAEQKPDDEASGAPGPRGKPVGGAHVGALTGAWLQIVINDLGCLQRLAETLGVQEDAVDQGTTPGTLGFAYMRRKLEAVLQQLQGSWETSGSNQTYGADTEGGRSVTGAAGVAIEVVNTAQQVFLGGRTASEQNSGTARSPVAC